MRRRAPGSTESLSLILRALAFAAHKHRDQRRKDPSASSYINHPIALANVLRNEGGIRSAEVICAALLHDTIEDTLTAPEEITAAFGERICDIVLEVTDDKKLPKAERKHLQVVHAAHASRGESITSLEIKAKVLAMLKSKNPEWERNWIVYDIAVKKRSS